jgi:hypothetical protein
MSADLSTVIKDLVEKRDHAEQLVGLVKQSGAEYKAKTEIAIRYVSLSSNANAKIQTLIYQVMDGKDRDISLFGMSDELKEFIQKAEQAIAKAPQVARLAVPLSDISSLIDSVFGIFKFFIQRNDDRKKEIYEMLETCKWRQWGEIGEVPIKPSQESNN